MFNKKNIIVLCSLCVVGAAVGGVGGWFLGSMYKPDKDIEGNVYYDAPVEYSTKNESTQRLLNVLGVDDEHYSSVDVTSAVGKNGITAAEIGEAVMYRVYKKNKFKFYSENTALSDAGIMMNTQNTDSTFIKVNDCYFKENISTSSTVRFAERYCNYDHKAANNPLIAKKPHENDIEYYRLISASDIPNNRVVNFSNAPKESYYINVPDDAPEGSVSFSTYFGISAFSAYNYEYKSQFALKDTSGNLASIQIKNAITGEEETFDTSIKSTDEGYEIRLAVSADACKNYANYVFRSTRDQTKLAKMNSLPEFESLGIHVYCDKNLNLTKFTTVEYYKVFSSLAGSVPTYCTSDILVSYSDSISLPTLSDITPKSI